MIVSAGLYLVHLRIVQIFETKKLGANILNMSFFVNTNVDLFLSVVISKREKVGPGLSRSQQRFIFSKLIIKTLEKGVKYVKI